MSDSSSDEEDDSGLPSERPPMTTEEKLEALLGYRPRPRSRSRSPLPERIRSPSPRPSPRPSTPPHDRFPMTTEEKLASLLGRRSRSRSRSRSPLPVPRRSPSPRPSPRPSPWPSTPPHDRFPMTTEEKLASLLGRQSRSRSRSPLSETRRSPSPRPSPPRSNPLLERFLMTSDEKLPSSSRPRSRSRSRSPRQMPSSYSDVPMVRSPFTSNEPSGSLAGPFSDISSSDLDEDIEPLPRPRSRSRSSGEISPDKPMEPPPQPTDIKKKPRKGPAQRERAKEFFLRAKELKKAERELKKQKLLGITPGSEPGGPGHDSPGPDFFGAGPSGIQQRRSPRELSSSESGEISDEPSPQDPTGITKKPRKKKILNPRQYERLLEKKRKWKEKKLAQQKLLGITPASEPGGPAHDSPVPDTFGAGSSGIQQRRSRSPLGPSGRPTTSHSQSVKDDQPEAPEVVLMGKRGGKHRPTRLRDADTRKSLRDALRRLHQPDQPD